MIQRAKSGFTLIELLIVIAIIAILAGIIIATLGNPTAEARNSTRVQALDSIADAAQQYLIDEATYPGNVDVLVTNGYITSLPEDPSTSAIYSYLTCLVDGNPRVVVGANLEDAGEASAKADSDFGAAQWTCDANPTCVPADGAQNPEICDAVADTADCSANLVYCAAR